MCVCTYIVCFDDVHMLQYLQKPLIGMLDTRMWLEENSQSGLIEPRGS